MDFILIAARFLLAATFAVAGLAKLADLTGSRKSMIGFGVPKAFAGALGLLLPVAELVAAGALIPGRTAWWGATGALALLLIFIAGISFNLARGRKPDCHCFGQLHSAPVGWKTLARNLILAGAALFVLWPGSDYVQPGIWSRLAALSGLQLALLAGGLAVLAALAVNLWLVTGVLRQSGRLLLRIEAIEERLGIGQSSSPPAGLPPDSPAPDFKLSELGGDEVSLKELCAAGKPVLLLFIEPECGPCDDLLPEVGAWQTGHAGRLTVAVISRGSIEANRAKKAGLTGILLQRDREVAEAYECVGTPGAVLVNADGTIGSHLAMGAEAIQSLVRRVTMPPPAKMGENAPQVRLPDLAGKTVDLESFRGSRTIVLFWNPGCGFCREILDKIKDWEKRPSGETPKLLVVSAGSVEDNRAQGFLSTVVLDEGFNTGNAFGVEGTPAAALVDENGKIASKAAVGGAEVLSLVSLQTLRL